jgi:hypothetical protein
MTTTEFAKLVQDMRRMQTAYFKNRGRETLRLSKQLEKQVDAEAAKILDGQGEML